MKTLFDAMVPSGCWGQSRGNHFIKAFARILLTAVALVGGADTKAAPFSLTLQGNSLQTTVQSGPVEAGFWPNFGQPKVDMTITVQTLAGAPVTALRFPSEGPTMPTMSYFAGGGIFHLLEPVFGISVVSKFSQHRHVGPFFFVLLTCDTEHKLAQSLVRQNIPKKLAKNSAISAPSIKPQDSQLQTATQINKTSVVHIEPSHPYLQGPL